MIYFSFPNYIITGGVKPNGKKRPVRGGFLHRYIFAFFDRVGHGTFHGLAAPYTQEPVFLFSGATLRNRTGTKVTIAGFAIKCRPYFTRCATAFECEPFHIATYTAEFRTAVSAAC